MAPVARELSSDWGVLEPLQTATSLDGQIQELLIVLKQNADIPVTLIGSSWGAMLSYIISARYPELVKKLILIGSAVYEEQYAFKIQQTRHNRLSEEDRKKARSLKEALNDPIVRDKNIPMTQLAVLYTKADTYDPITLDIEVLDVQHDLSLSVWNDAVELRKSGQLLDLGKQIQCPVVAIHGDYDPHPSEGVLKPLSAVLKNFHFILLKNCGHLPWIERGARDKFYEILKEELQGGYNRQNWKELSITSIKYLSTTGWKTTQKE